MKTIGMLGGMSWESTTTYYQLINRGVQARLGGVHSAKIVMASFDFAEVSALQHAGKWDEATAMLGDAGAKLAASGADFAMICCNTMHLLAEGVQARAGIPFLHIADATGAAIAARGMKRIGLLGSIYTMEQGGVIADRLEEKFGLGIITPNDADRVVIDTVIQDELVRGQFLEASRAAYRAVMARLVDAGAQGIILGCTEIPLLVGAGDAPVPLFDTTALHAAAAVDLALG